jgi:EmrB/QacA subfamily drug resistance transporter
MPGSLSILTVTFPPTERAKAIGTWAGVSGLALAFGPTAGGFLVEHVGWQSIFFLNVPIGIIAFFVALRVVRESYAEQARELDLIGLGLGTAGLLSITYALIEANQLGWGNAVIVGALSVGAIFLVAFCSWEYVTPHPMMPLDFFRIPAFSAGTTVAFCISLGMFGTFFFFSLYMQLIRGYSALQTGVRILPITGMIFFVAPIAGRWAQKHGSRGAMTLGPLLSGTGLLFLSRVGVNTDYKLMVPVLMMMGIGMGLTMSPMTAAVMNAVGAQRAGLGSAMTNTAREAGGVFGIALLGTLLTTQLRSALTSTLAGLGIDPARRLAIIGAAGHGTLDPRLLGGLTPGQARAVRQAFSLAFMKGMHLAFMVAAFFVIAAAVVANRFVPSGAPQDDREPSRDGDGRRAAAVARSTIGASAGNGRARTGARESLSRSRR